MKRGRLFLIDGNSYCYRAYYAIKGLANSKGFPTNAVYGFVLMLRKLVSTESPDYLAIAFDMKAPTFRHRMFEDYKIQRKPMPDDLVLQLPLIKEVVKAFNIPIFEMEGFEADDILATIAKKAEKQGLEVFIVTGDKDALQIVNERIKVYSTHKEGLVYDAENIKKRFSGLGPGEIVDFMALAGDASDNIPGVKGVGEKGAIQLIKEFGNIENLFSNLEKVKSESKRKVLASQEENAFMSKELATIDYNVPIEIDLEELKIREPDCRRLGELFKELEFKSLAMEFAGEGMSGLRASSQYKIVSSLKGFDKLVADLKEQREFAFDFETTSENPVEAEPVGVSFCWRPGEAYYIPLIREHKSEVGAEYAFERLRPVMEDDDIKKIGQNIKYEKLILSNYGVNLRGVAFDTMIASYLINPSRFSHNLDDMAFEWLNHKMISLDEILGTGKKRISIKDVPVEKLSEYACEDSDITFRLKGILEKELFSRELENLFRDIEMPLIDVLAEMEKAGVKIDTDFLEEMAKNINRELSDIVIKIYNMAGTEFNINSPRQLSDVLFTRLNLPVVKKTKTGFSTDVGVLEQLAAIHPLPAELLRYRELSKLKSTYIETLPRLVSRKTGRLHTSFNQTITATGRLSSSNPNLQNIPVKTPQGREIRRAFVGEKGNVIVSADYSQIELRILAHLSGDEELIRAFEEGLDIHSHTASLIFGVDESSVSPEERARAKTVNFGIVYGMSAFGLSRSLSIDPASAQEFIDAYFERYPRVRLYMEEVIEEAREAGYVTTLFNRRRYIPEIKTGSHREQRQAERIAINTPVQGSAADLIKIVMINLHRDIKERGMRSRMILQVHDELVFEVPKRELQDISALIKERMERSVSLKVPIEVNIKCGPNWLDMSDIKEAEKS